MSCERPRHRATGAALGLGLLLIALAGGCLGSSPPVSYYALASVPQPAGDDATTLAISVGPVQLPRMLEQPQIVVRRGPNRVEYDEFNRWAGSLGTQVNRALGQGLGQRLGTGRIVVYPSPPPFPVDYRVVVGVEELNARAGEAVVLRARYGVLPGVGGEAVAVGTVSLRAPLAGSDPEAIVAGHDEVLAGLSEAIADRIRGLGP